MRLGYTCLAFLQRYSCVLNTSHSFYSGQYLPLYNTVLGIIFIVNRQIVVIYNMKQGILNSSIVTVIISKFCYQKKLYLVILFSRIEYSEVMLQGLILSFYLTIGLWIEGYTQPTFYIRIEIDLGLKGASKNKASVCNNTFQRVILSDDFIKKQLC